MADYEGERKWPTTKEKENGRLRRRKKMADYEGRKTKPLNE